MRIHSRDLFPSDEPIPLARMIGRRGDVEQLVLQLSGGAHRIVAAPRRTGKTSVCEAAIKVLSDVVGGDGGGVLRHAGW